MKKFFFVLLHALIGFSLLGCTMDVSQPTISSPTAAATAITSDTPTSAVKTTVVPMAWARLGLTGRIVFASVVDSEGVPSTDIKILDLTTGIVTTLFDAPEGAWVFYITVSPDAKQLVMSYIPHVPSSPSGVRILYIMPMDGSKPPQPLFLPPTANDHYTQAEWTPDGKYIYYTHYNDQDPPDEQLNPPYDISRIAYPDGQPEKIISNAFWPRLSRDSTKIVYVALEPITGKNDLFVANADGSNPQKVTLSGSWIPELVDAPIFSPDGQSIFFSAPVTAEAYQRNWLDRLMGVQIARAHSVPSDWWSVPILGGTSTRLTQIQAINLFASISPDGKYIASASGEGIFVMKPDGSNLTLIMQDSFWGTLSWVP